MGAVGIRWRIEEWERTVTMKNTKQVKHYRVGVDSAMVWIGDPCYFGREMVAKFREDLMTGRVYPELVAILKDEAVVVESGYGDGLYDVAVYTACINGPRRVTKVTITFIDEEVGA